MLSILATNSPLMGEARGAMQLGYPGVWSGWAFGTVHTRDDKMEEALTEGLIFWINGKNSSVSCLAERDRKRCPAGR